MIGLILGQLYKIKRHLSKNDRLRRLVPPSCMLDCQDAQHRRQWKLNWPITAGQTYTAV